MQWSSVKDHHHRHEPQYLGPLIHVTDLPGVLAVDLFALHHSVDCL